jgi:hypothetical protein
LVAAEISLFDSDEPVLPVLDPLVVMPGSPEPYCPETDAKLCAAIRSDFAEQMDTINRRRLGESTNEAAQYLRRATQKLIKKLAEANELTEAQVKRIVGLKR